MSFSAKQMYDLVNNVNEYHHFVPGCEQSEILEQSSTHMRGKLVVAKAGIKQTLITENKLTENAVIEITLSDGPFKSFYGVWRFLPLSDEACKIELDLDFQFSSKVIQFAFGKIFNALANSMVDAFSERAKQVYK